MKFKLVFIRECWDLWNFIKLRLVYLVIILLLLISVLFVNSESSNLLDVIYEILKVNEHGEKPLVESINWLTIQLLPLMVMGSYVYEGLFLSGPFLLMRIMSRNLLWISKILLLFIVSIVYYLFIFILIELFGLFFDFSFGFERHFLYEKIPSIALSFLIGTCVLLLLQSVVSMFLKPIFGFMLSIVLCVLNIYAHSLIIPGNISDVLSYSIINGDLSFITGVIVQLIWIGLLALFGGYYYKNADLLYKI